jgi:predicted outer membrane protein
MQPNPGAMQAGTQGGNAGSELLRIEVRTVDTWLPMVRSELAKQQGRQFDFAFIGQEIGLHTWMTARLQAVEPFVKGDLKPAVNDMLNTTQEHLKVARSIMKDLDSQANGTK